MTGEHENVGTFLKIFEAGEDYASVEASDEGSVDAAVERWVSSRETHDTLLHLTLVDGDTYCVKASRISGWMRSTPEGRRRSAEFHKTLEDEITANRRAAGFIEGS